MLFWKAEARHIREIKQRRFGETHVNREGSLFLLIYLDGSKFVFLKASVFSFGDDFLRIRAKSLPNNAKIQLTLDARSSKTPLLTLANWSFTLPNSSQIFFSRKALAKNHNLSSWFRSFNSRSILCNILFLLIAKFFCSCLSWPKAFFLKLYFNKLQSNEG